MEALLVACTRVLGDEKFSSFNIASVVLLGIGRKSECVEIVGALISRYDVIDTRNVFLKTNNRKENNPAVLAMAESRVTDCELNII